MGAYTECAPESKHNGKENQEMSAKFGPSGGIGGSPYDAPAQDPDANGPWTINKISGWSETRINEITIWWTNPDDSEVGNSFGEMGGEVYTFEIAKGDFLTQIRGSVGENECSWLVYSLQFVTQNGVVSPIFGEPTAEDFEYICPPGYQITGIFGRSGGAVDALGVYIDPID